MQGILSAVNTVPTDYISYIVTSGVVLSCLVVLHRKYCTHFIKNCEVQEILFF
jgi:hypothetical protein